MKWLVLIAVVVFLTGCNTNLVFINKDIHVDGNGNQIVTVGSSLSDVLKDNAQTGGDPILETPMTAKGVKTIDGEDKGIIMEKDNDKENKKIEIK